MDLPIICTLTEAELHERRQTVLAAIRNAAVKVEELPDGYAFSFAASSEVLTQLVRLVDLERQCCQFLSFKILVEAGNKPVRLEVTGPLEAKTIVAEFFGTPA